MANFREAMKLHGEFRKIRSQPGLFLFLLIPHSLFLFLLMVPQSRCRKVNQRKPPAVNQLGLASQNILDSLEVSRRQNGEPGQSGSSVGMPPVSTSSGMTFSTTGLAEMPSAAAERQTGPQPGDLVVAPSPRTADEARALAVSLVTDSLPLSLQQWLDDMEYHRLVVASVGGLPPVAPERTPETMAIVSQLVRSLSEILQPARNRGPELEAEILKLFAAFNLYTGDQAKLNTQLAVWAEELEEFPMFAIRKAYRWAVRGGERLPSLAAFITDVREAIGQGVIQRKRHLENWLAGR